MSKKAPVKKTKRRLKRTVRRSIAALLMITAIGVAAIPVPENYAGNTSSSSESRDLSYNEEYTDIKYDVVNSNLDNNVYSLNIYNGGLYWQYRFNSAYNNRIAEYNSSYPETSLEIKKNVPTQYWYVSKSEYDTFIEDDEEFSMRVDDYAAGLEEKKTEDFFEMFFEEDNEYKDFQKKVEQYNSGDDSVKDITIKRHVAELNEENRGIWYCYSEEHIKDCSLKLIKNMIPDSDVTTKPLDDLVKPDKTNYEDEKDFLDALENYNKALEKLEKYKNHCAYEQVAGDLKQEYGDSVNVGEFYIPYYVGEEELDPLIHDENGYLIKNSNTISSIGDYAFAGKGILQTVDLPKDIKKIGEGAFMKCSYLQSVNIPFVTQIPDAAFKYCSNLTTVNWWNSNNNVNSSTLTTIGKEAFWGSGIQNTGVQNGESDSKLIFPNQIIEIDDAAFYGCGVKSIEFESGQASETEAVRIGKYAFYNCPGLNESNFGNKKVDELGDYCFAIGMNSNSMTEFTFPNSSLNTMGENILANRTALKKITVPENFDSLGANTLVGCSNLEEAVFLGTNTKYNPTTFNSVTNKKFFVSGPARKTPNPVNDDIYDASEPRKSTWAADKTAAGQRISYKYKIDGKTFSEISDDTYIMSVDEENKALNACQLRPNAESTKPIELEIPSEVAGVKVISIATDCFQSSELNERVTKLVIPDDSIQIIEDGVFKAGGGDNGKDWLKLKTVKIGNSVSIIGSEAFAGCYNLEDVYFNKPTVGYEKFSMEDDAFATAGAKLTFHGNIVEGYKPFTIAMNSSNQLKDKNNLNKPAVNICYQSLWNSDSIENNKTSTHLTVMTDKSGNVTLLDYPKMEDFNDVLADEELKDFCEDMEQYYYMQYDNDSVIVNGKTVGELRKNFVIAKESGADNSELEKYYGPWINPAFCSNGAWRKYLDNQASVQDDAFDWLFKPLIVEASGDPVPYYKENSSRYNFMKNYDLYLHNPSAYDELPEYEKIPTIAWNYIDATKEIYVPKAVTSIDVVDYKKNNPDNYNTYIVSDRMHTSTTGGAVPGLFSGYYEDYALGDSRENDVKGNDTIESVILTNVKKLPDYAFDNCEMLDKVELGAVEEVGVLPFRGCRNLTSLQGSNKYPAENGILYEKKDDGNYKIVECLMTRGKSTDANSSLDSTGVAFNPDSRLPEVDEIAESAFEDCEGIAVVDLTDSLVKVIPENCFKNCKGLINVLLPTSVNQIEDNSFEGIATSTHPLYVTIPGREVDISDIAFNPKQNVTIYTYEDSAAYSFAKRNGIAVEKLESFRVYFYDYDGKPIGDVQIAKKDSSGQFRVTEPEDADKLYQTDHRPGYKFTGWKSTDDKTLNDPITADMTIFVAQYEPDGTLINGKCEVTFVDGIDGKTLGDTSSGATKVTLADGSYRYVYYVKPGMSFSALKSEGVEVPGWRDHEKDGYKFVKWMADQKEWTESTVIKSSMSVVALYEKTTTSGGTTTTSGGSTTTSGSTTTTSSSKNSSNTSSSTSSSSSNTSSSSNSSNTSGSNSTAGTYTVTVENGSGSGTYAAGSTVIIAANTPADGMTFSKWTTESNGVTLASVSLPATTFVMPANNVTVTANYVAGNGATAAANGTGNGDSKNGNTVVDITKPGISNRDLATANVSGSTDGFVVKISETDEATQAVAAALTNKYGSLDNILYYAMDITLWDSTGTYQLTGDQVAGLSVDITIPIPDALVTFGGNNMAGAVVNGDQLENLNESFTTINGVPCIRFTATHFSPYTIYVDTDNLTEGMLDVTPKTGDPIHPKWFLSIGLACLSIILFMKKDKRVKVKAA